MTMPLLTITPFDPKTAKEQEWEWIIEFQISNFKEANPNDPAPPPELIRQSMMQITDSPHHDIEIFLASEQGSFCGAYGGVFQKESSPEYERAKHVVLGVLWVHPDYRQRGIGTQLLKKLATLSAENNTTVLQIDSGIDAGYAFAEKFGGKVSLIGNTSRLYMNKVDWDKMQSWYDAGKQRLSDVQIEQFDGQIPTNEEDYCAFYTEVANQQPFADTEGMEDTQTPETMGKKHREMKELGTRWITFITREPNGAISGMTEITQNEKRPHIAGQLLTGVKESYRGRGLGKYLKSAMMLYVRDEFPDVEYISTTNATINAPMLKINQDMGFEFHREMRLYKFSLADLVARLA